MFFFLLHIYVSKRFVNVMCLASGVIRFQFIAAVLALALLLFLGLKPALYTIGIIVL